MNEKALLRKRARLIENHKMYEIEKPEKTFNFFGGFSSGYIKGKLSVIEDLLDEMNPERIFLKYIL